VKTQNGYEGGLTNPLTWERTVEKFQWLAEPFASECLRNKIVNTVQQLDAKPISDLMELLAQVSSTVLFPRTLKGIQ
jgi:2-methylcitrate dehydratase